MIAAPPITPWTARRLVAALSIIAVLPVAGFAAPPPEKAAAKPAKEDPVVAKVGDWPIHASDVERLSESLPPSTGTGTQPEENRYLSLAVREEVLFQWTVGGKFRGDRALRDKVKATVFQHIVETQVKPKVKVTNAEIRKYYEDNLDLVRGGHVRVRRIYLAKPTACDTLRQEIDSESSFIAAAQRLSQDRNTAAAGGDLGYVLPTNGPLGYEKRLFAMRPGEMRVFKGAKGCDLVRLVEKTDPPIPPLNEVRDSLRAYLESQQEERYLEELVTEARKTVKVKLYLKRPVAALSSRQGTKP